EKHQLFRQSEKFVDGHVPDRPGFLRRGVETMFARNQHDRLHEEAEIDPLAKAHLAVNGEENGYRRIEETEVLRKLLKAARLVLARNANGCIHILTAFEAARLVRLGQALRINVIFRPLAEGIVLLPGFDDREKLL